jgi:hypothetical protein
MEFGDNKKLTNDKMPEQVRSILPERGIVFISGGLMSSGSRLVLDIDKKKIEYAMNKGANSTPYGKLPGGGSIQLNDQDLENAVQMANAIWASDKSFSRMPPIPDFDVILILADGKEFKGIYSYGPPVGEVDELYKFLWGRTSRSGQMVKV